MDSWFTVRVHYIHNQYVVVSTPINKNTMNMGKFPMPKVRGEKKNKTYLKAPPRFHLPFFRLGT